MGSSYSTIEDKKSFSIVIPDTENIETGSGAIRRHYACANGLEKSYSPDVNTLYDNFLYAYNLNPKANFVGWRPIVNKEAQPYTFYTYEEARKLIEAYSRVIVKYDFLSKTGGYEIRHDGTPIETMGHFMKNSMQLLLSEFAAWRVNGTIVPLYDTLGEEAIAHVCEEAELKTILCSPVSAAFLLRSIQDNPENYKTVKNIIVAAGEIDSDLQALADSLNIRLFSFDSLIEEGKTLEDPPLPPVHGDDFCMICYTSGTTGVPKGALFSHQNLISVGAVCRGYIFEMSHFGSNDYYISYLPMAHAFEHFMQTACIAAGMGIGFSQGDTRKIVDDFRELRPAVFASVPRLLERIIGKVKDTIAQKNAVIRGLWKMAFETKKHVIMRYNTGKCPLWDTAVFKPILRTVGLDNVRAMVTGSAPITAENLLFLRVLFQTNVLQGLGATETSGGACVSLPTDFNTFDHCGCPIRAMEAKLVSVPEMGYLITDRVHGRIQDKNGDLVSPGIPCEGRGEACFRGYNVIKGYYRQSHINEATFDVDGWFHSGDIAIWNQYGGLQIVDRKKDLFKLSQGEYISPDKVTGVYMACNLVGNLFVYGDSYQSYLVAVVVPSEHHLREALKLRGIQQEGIAFADLCKMPEVKAVMFDEMNKVANQSKLCGFEKLKNIYLDSENWTIENGMLTPTMKLKRKVSKEKYMEVIQNLYKEGVYTPPKKE